MADEQPQQPNLDELVKQMQSQQAEEQAHEGEKPKEKEDLEDKVDGGAWNTFKHLAYLGTTIAAAAYLGGSLMLIDAAAVSLGFMGGKIAQKIIKKDTTSYVDVLKD